MDINQTPPFAVLSLAEKQYRLPIVVGSEGERAIDIRQLMKSTGYTVLDSGFKNSASCSSSIT